MIQFKDPHLKEEFWQISPYLRRIVCEAEVFLVDHGGYDVVITQLIRTDGEQLDLFQRGLTKSRVSVHQFGRGCDCRITFPDDVGVELVKFLNDNYTYDPARRNLHTALIHGGTARHLHLQVAI